MSRRAATWLAWSLWAVCLGVQVVIMWLIATGQGHPEELLSVVTVGYVTMGALVATRRPDNAVGWLLVAIGIGFTLSAFGAVYVSGRSSPAWLPIAFFAAWSLPVWIVLAAGFLPLVFPDGRLVSPRWRPVIWLGVAAPVLSIIGAAFTPGRLELSEPVQNPLGVSGPAADLVAVSALVGNALIVLFCVLAVLSLALRFHRSRGIERQQLKWFAYAGLVTFAGLALNMVRVLFPDDWRESVGAVGWFTFTIAIAIGLPVAVGIAILRHRLFDIDLVINRTLVYGALTILLAASYLGLVLLFQLVLNPFTEQSDLGVAGSTLAVAALFRPLRSRIQRVVDRRFFRQRYDAVGTLEGFSMRMRDELDLETLGTHLRRVARDTMQPAHVSLWLRSSP